MLNILDDIVQFDFETMGTRSSAMVLDLSLVAVSMSTIKDWTFDSLRARSCNIKFDCSKQTSIGRTVDNHTVEWWSSQQSEEAKAVLKPSVRDVSLSTIDKTLKDYFKKLNFDSNKATWFSRGFMDASIICDIYQTILPEEKTPFEFWSFDDNRTLIRSIAEVKKGKFDLPPEYLPDDGKVCVHNSVDDCVLDLMRIKYLYDNLTQ